MTVKHQHVYDGLSNMLAAGVGLTAALRTSVAQGSGAIRNAVMAVAKSIESGNTLTTAMTKHPRIFPGFDVAVIETAEMSGQLSEAFHALASWYRLRSRIWHIITSGTAYPAIIMHAGAFILPLPMLFRGHTVAEYLLAAFSTLFYLYLSVGAIFFIYKISRGSNPFRRVVDTVLLTIPLLGQALHNLAFGRYCFGFLMLYRCGVSMEKTAGFATGLTGNAAVSAMFEGCVRCVRQGLPVSKGFSPAVPADFKALWITGETSGRLDETLEKLYEDRMEIGQDYLKRFARWLPHIMYAIFVLILLNSMVGRFSSQIQLP